MFGIGRYKERAEALAIEITELFSHMKERLDSLTSSEFENKTAIHSMQSQIMYIKSDILKLSGQFGQFKEDANPVTTRRADELAVAVAKCSADMAELDRRLCNIENALAATKMPREYSQQLIQETRPTTEHFNGDPAQQPLELSRKKKYVQRVESAAVARTIVAIDKDAARIVESLKRRGIHQRIIDACIAAGVVDATRNKRDIVVREKRRHGNRRYYNASIRCCGDHSRDIGFVTALEAGHCMREMQSVVRYVADYFATGMVFDEGKPNGGKS